MTFDRIFWLGLSFLWFVVVTVLLVMISREALAEDHTGHPLEHAQLHDTFYSNWNRPDMRNVLGDRKHSCCNNEDCAPVDRIEFRADGTIWALRNKDQRWVKVPEIKIESNQVDPRESPDGRSHMCSSGDTVFCFVLGSAT